MPRRFVNVSMYLEKEVRSDPPMLALRITYPPHKDRIGEFRQRLPGSKAEGLRR